MKPVNLLWLSGTAGFGKSVLPAYLTKQLPERYPSTLVGYFFCKRNELLQEVHPIVRCFLFQIFMHSSDVRTFIASVWQQSESIASCTASGPEFFNTLFLPSLHYLQKSTMDVLFIIDGVNEEKITKILQFLDLLKSVSDAHSQLPRIRNSAHF